MRKLEIKPVKSIIKGKKQTAKKKDTGLKNVKADTLKQEIYCQSWVDSIGNGTAAALMAFDITGKEILDKEKPARHIAITVGTGKKAKKVMVENPESVSYYKEVDRIEHVAGVMSVEYLRKPSIRKRIDEILEEREFNDEGVKREHFKLIRNANDHVKVRAIDMYYKLTQKYTDATINLTIEDIMQKSIDDRHKQSDENNAKGSSQSD